MTTVLAHFDNGVVNLEEALFDGGVEFVLGQCLGLSGKLFDLGRKSRILFRDAMQKAFMLFHYCHRSSSVSRLSGLTYSMAFDGIDTNVALFEQVLPGEERGYA